MIGSTWGRSTRLAAIALSLALQAACGSRLPAPGQLEGGSASVEVPSRFLGGHVYLRVELEGRDTAWLVLDTGAQLIILDDRLARRLGSELAGTSRLTGYGEAVLEGQVLSGLAVRAPGALAFETNVPVVDLSTLDRYAGVTFEGFLGAPLFHRFVVEIDYEAERVVLHDAERFRPRQGDARLKLEVRRGIPFVDGAIVLPDGTVARGRFVLDTGMRSGMTIGTPFVAEHDLLERVGRTARQPVAGVGGISEDLLAQLAAFRLGPFVIRAPVGQFATAAAGAAVETDRAGAIGSEILRRFNVIVDFRREALYLRPNRFFDDPFSHEMTGAAFTAHGENLDVFVVEWIDEGSPAQAAGLVPDDTLAEIDGRSLDGLKLWEVRALLRGEDETVIQVVVRRNGELVPLRIRLTPRI